MMRAMSLRSLQLDVILSERLKRVSSGPFRNLYNSLGCCASGFLCILSRFFGLDLAFAINKAVSMFAYCNRNMSTRGGRRKKWHPLWSTWNWKSPMHFHRDNIHLVCVCVCNSNTTHNSHTLRVFPFENLMSASCVFSQHELTGADINSNCTTLNWHTHTREVILKFIDNVRKKVEFVAAPIALRRCFSQNRQRRIFWFFSLSGAWVYAMNQHE